MLLRCMHHEHLHGHEDLQSGMAMCIMKAICYLLPFVHSSIHAQVLVCKCSPEAGEILGSDDCIVHVNVLG